MIKLTVKYYKVKPEAQLRVHNIQQLQEEELFEWEEQIKHQKMSGGGEYVPRPFLEPIEHENGDYEITNRRFRCRLEDITYYTENADDEVEATLFGDKQVVIVENIEYLDNLFGLE